MTNSKIHSNVVLRSRSGDTRYLLTELTRNGAAYSVRVAILNRNTGEFQISNSGTNFRIKDIEEMVETGAWVILGSGHDYTTNLNERDDWRDTDDYVLDL